MRASFADIAGVRTRFFQHGEGDYGVVLIHGVGVGADSWLWNVEALGQGRLAVAPDLLGYGLTGEGSYREGPPHESMVEIGIGGSLATPPLPHHLAYGSVPRRFEKLG
jgi:pimeloyl-ACP methyl ester carboxylesterase